MNKWRCKNNASMLFRKLFHINTFYVGVLKTKFEKRLHFYSKCSISVQTQYKPENLLALGQQNKPHSLLFKLVKLANIWLLQLQVTSIWMFGKFLQKIYLRTNGIEYYCLLNILDSEWNSETKSREIWVYNLTFWNFHQISCNFNLICWAQKYSGNEKKT